MPCGSDHAVISSGVATAYGAEQQHRLVRVVVPASAGSARSVAELVGGAVFEGILFSTTRAGLFFGCGGVALEVEDHRSLLMALTCGGLVLELPTPWLAVKRMTNSHLSRRPAVGPWDL
jgi:hypothetical protein